MKRIQIFKAGKQTAKSGESVDFSSDALKAAAAAYDPKVHEAPLTIGHTKTSSPAYGWISGISFSEQDGALEATTVQVDPEFSELVQAGRYKKVSATFYKPDSPHNPKPGVFYLRDVAFLGAEPPAVKGLKAVEFAEGQEGLLEFTDWQDLGVARMFRGLREWLIGKFGKDEADKALPDWPIADAEMAAIKASNPNTSTTEYQESQMKPEDLQAAQAKIASDRQALEEREKTIAKREADARHQAHVEFAEGAIKEGKLLPAHKAVVVALLGALPDGTLEFSEGDQAVKKAPAAALQDFIRGLPKLVEFAEHGNKGVDGLDVNNSDAVAAKALEFQEAEAKAGRTVSTSDAVNHIIKGATA